MKKTTLTLATLTTAIFATTAVNAELVINGDKQSNTIPTQQITTPINATPAKDVKTVAKGNNSYTLDPNHANVRFAIDHFGTTTNQGAFYGLTGDMTFNPAKKTGSIDVVIPMNNLETGNKHFTDHLKSKDFFNAEQYPTAEFKSTKFYFNGDKVSKVTGNLTLLGKTNPVTLTATKFNCYDSPMLKTQVCGGDFETTINRTKWGMDGYVKMGFSKNVKLNIQVEASKS